MLTDNNTSVYRNSTDYNNGTTGNITDSLYEFLKAAELQQYFDDLSAKLKVRSIAQLKYVDETDLQTIGMTRPEMRRLKKYFAKEFPQTAMGKIKKKLSRTTSCRSTSVPRPDDSCSRMASYSVRVSSNGQSKSPNDSDDLATLASVTNYSIASNGTNDSSEWRQLGNKHQISHTQLTIGSLLRHGDVGDLFKGHLRSAPVPIEVAVKVITRITLRNEFNDFVREMFGNCSLNHPNVTKLYGISLDDFSIKMVTDLSALGSLQGGLSAEGARAKYSVTVLHGFLTQVSDAMNYLEERRITHGRLTGTNVLIFPNNQVKVTDAGLFKAHNCLERSRDSDVCLWFAPELCKGSKESLKSDVWAFGVLLWDMFSYYEQPCLSSMDESVSSHVDLRLQRLQQPDLCPNMVYQIIRSCWTEIPKDRPTFYQLSTQLVRLEPEQVVALADGPDLLPTHRPEEANEPSDGSYSSLSDLQMLDYKVHDVIVVLDRSMNQYRELWRGCLLTGRSGYFKWANMRALRADYPPRNDQTQAQKAKTDKESPDGSIKSTDRSIGETFKKIRISRREEKKKVSIDMISGPQNDFRHVGHVGANGEVFGDVTSLYATGAQKKVPSGSTSISIKGDYPGSISHNGGTISSPAINTAQTAHGISPCATMDNESLTAETTKPIPSSEKSAKKGGKTLHFAHPPQPAPPLPPTRAHADEESSTNVYLDDFGLSNDFSICNDNFSLFDELSKHWDMHSSKIESPTSETIVGTSLNGTSLLSSSTDRESPSLNAGYSEVYDEPLASMETCIPVISPTEVPTNITNKSHKSVSRINSAELSGAKSNIFQKLRVFGAGKPSKSKELSEGQKSPVYAKLNKQAKSKKQKDTKDSKKNIIGMPVLISGPVNNGNEYTDDNGLDCSSEVSSLQPSPHESTLCLTNGASTDHCPSFQALNSNLAVNPHRKNSDSVATSISHASSTASLSSTPAPAVLQGGGALRALRKGDCVFRATSTANAINRKRPSVGQIHADQPVNEAIVSRSRQLNPTFVGAAQKGPISVQGVGNNSIGNADNYEKLDLEVGSSSATTPIAAALPDLPYIDLTYARNEIPEKTNPCDEDDEYNSLHSGSVGSDTLEPRSTSRQPDLSCHNDDSNGNVKSIYATLHALSKKDDLMHTRTSHQSDSNGGVKSTKKYSFNNANIFAMYGDNDEVAL